MSWLSQATGIHISPHGVGFSKPDPIGVAKTALTNPLFDGALAIGLPGIGSAITGALGAIPGIGGALASGAGAVGGALGSAAGEAGTALSSIPGVSGLESGLGGALKGAEGFLTGNGGKNAIGVAQGINGILDQKKAENYGKDALGAATGAYNAAAPLRAQGIAGLLNPQSANLSGLQGIAGSLQQPAPAGNDALQAQLAQLHAPQASPASNFTPPTRKAGTSVASALKDPGNPYGRAS